ncbi:MAG: hypothetical protein OEY20_15230 [Gemmatimonadota bacterium]|nr:hypothetical protein [Gemmatimonadota bacterium]MDH4350493.1 hypothetical protein [Gemmatimonadota bacterium]MDH5198593.1 hypothetical protein [Gemmatimonadota bacterium]
MPLFLLTNQRHKQTNNGTNLRRIVLLVTVVGCGSAPVGREIDGPKNFIYCGVERSRISEASFLECVCQPASSPARHVL